jgi:hypothetical protein
MLTPIDSCHCPSSVGFPLRFLDFGGGGVGLIDKSRDARQGAAISAALLVKCVSQMRSSSSTNVHRHDPDFITGGSLPVVH